MKAFQFTFKSFALTVALALVGAGCETTNTQPSRANSTSAKSSSVSSKYKTDDGRTIEIGKAAPSGDGVQYRNPHMDKCWVANGINFADYDTVYVAPTQSTAKFQPDEAQIHEATKALLVKDLARTLQAKHVFANVVTSESEIKPGARALKLETTITQYSKGGGAARYFVGLYGGGQPILRVQGKMTDATKPVFSFEAQRSGTSAAARMTGAFMKDEDIQNEDVHSLAIDLTDFLAAMAGKYQAKN